jgi:cytochrome c oxidase subunit II
MRTRRLLLVLTLSLTPAGCANLPKSLEPAGPNADLVAQLFWWFTAVSVVVWGLVVLGLGIALLRPRPAGDGELPLERGRSGEIVATRIVVSLVALTTVVLVALTLLSFFSGRGLARISGQQARVIELTGHQWWWEVRYPDHDPARTLTDANEVHVPAGQPVRLVLRSTDVIHSFWIPNVSGKRDLIPGQVNRLDFTVRKPGVYRGQCAEFCGFQHAHMGLVLVAHPAEDFDAWYKSQLAPASQPSGKEAQAGQGAFLSSSCSLCHTIRGTPAGGKVGPDLTHVASRRGVAAHTLPMTRGALAAWIADPQAVKPGAHMPRTELTPDQLNGILAYLEQLE